MLIGIKHGSGADEGPNPVVWSVKNELPRLGKSEIYAPRSGRPRAGSAPPRSS